MSRSKKTKDKKAFIRKPEYPGGREALQKFLKKHLKYPKEAVKNKVEGTVYLGFRVDHNGDVQDVQVRKGIGHGCDEEAMRIVKMLKYSPQKNRGSRVSVQHKMNINFKLPKEKKTAVKRAAKAPSGKRTISYTYKATSKKPSGTATKKAEKKAEKYTYTVRVKPKSK